MTYKQYQRKQIAELADWHEGFDMAGVSVSDADKAAGSPKQGDKIARNPKNHADRWLVAADYFAENFSPCSAPDEALIEGIADNTHKRWAGEKLTFLFCVKWAIREYIRRSAGKDAIHDREALIQRLKDCQRRIDDMCKEGRPPKMSIPAQPDYDDDLVICQVISDVIAALSAQGGEQTDTVSVPSDTEMLNWLEDNHYFNGEGGVDRDTFTWEFRTPNNGRQWQPIREKIAEAMLAAAKEGKK